MKKIKFYTKINNTIVRCDKVRSLSEVLMQSFDGFLEKLRSGDLPMEIMVDKEVLEQINKDIARKACSRYYTECCKIYLDTQYKPVIEIRSL